MEGSPDHENMAGRKEEESGKEETMRSNSHSSGNYGDPSFPLLYDDTNNIEINIIPSDLSPSSQAQTPVPPEVTSATPLNDDKIRSIKSELYTHARYGWWRQAKPIVDAFPDMIRTPLTNDGNTALHVAVLERQNTFVKGLVSNMAPQDLEITNSCGRTAFSIAALFFSWKIEDSLRCMIQKNENLHLIRGELGLLPVEWAVVHGHHDAAQFLTSEDLLDRMELKDIHKLFFMTIGCNMFDVATKLLEKYPDKLAIARDDQQQLTALHMLARMPTSREIYKLTHNIKEWEPVTVPRSECDQRKLCERLWYHIKQLEYKTTLELISKPWAVLFEAVTSGNYDVVECLLATCPQLLAQRDSNGRTLLHSAALYRQRDILRFILDMKTLNLILRAVDNDGNNVLHFAAHLSKEASSSWKPYSQMPEEHNWFEGVEKRVPRELRIMRNNKGETPKDTFDADHKELYERVKEEAKEIANSSMVVAALIATIAFAAALTVPGDKNSASFVVFILTNAIALFTSSASIIYLLSVFTSSPTVPKELLNNISLHLIVKGRKYLMISVVAMVISFVAASFLIFGHMYKWVAYVTAVMAVPPIILLLARQADLYIERLCNCFMLMIFQCIPRCIWVKLSSG